ncbi:MAG: glycoside hydrolase family 2 TIM barrel-domain containing protein, partial [Verrucomicrobiota bacterium]
LDLPHDWSIEGPIAETNSSGFRGGFVPTGIGWYRKHFTLSPDAAGKTIFIQFDGVMANSDVYINGFALGHRPNGWVSFQYDLTGHVTFGPDKPNVIAVRCDNSAQPASRFYTGSGIYRHVFISVLDPVHIDHDSIIVTTPAVSPDKATVIVKTTIDNQSAADANVSLAVSLTSTAGTWAGAYMDGPGTIPAPTTVPAGKSLEITGTYLLPKPAIWSLDTPYLYHATVTVLSAGKTLDAQRVTFGVRQFEFKADTGFWLNGKNFKLLGAAVHSEGGAFGVAVPDRVWEQRLATLKSLGVNAIRTAHNPPSPDFLDICDRLGLLVMDEMFDVWTVRKYQDQDYSDYFRQWWRPDLTDTFRRDRNHPSVVIWSLGNEIHDNLASAQGKQQFTDMRDLAHKLDTARPVTMAILQPVQHNIFSSGFSDLMDVVGVNYREQDLLNEHRQRPDYKILGTENHSDAGVWLDLRDNPAYSGQFLWTGIDYLGEAGAWPRIGSGSGLIDRDSLIKPMGYQRQSWWSTQPMVYVTRGGAGGRGGRGGGARGRGAAGAPPDEAANAAATEEGGGAGGGVTVYSNCQQVELFLNGQSLGSKPKPANDSPRTWTAAAGNLKAVGYNDGKPVATYELHAAGPAAKVALAAYRGPNLPNSDLRILSNNPGASLPHDYDDVSIIQVTITDADGNPVAGATPEVRFAIAGPGAIAAIDNGAADNHGPFQGNQVRAAGGQCTAYIRSTADSGTITVTATAENLANGTVTLVAQPPRKK